MKNNDYGWLDTTRLLNQTSGFFVDDKDQILYWPTSEPKAFKLEEKEIFEMFDAMKKAARPKLQYLGCLAILAITGLLGFLFWDQLNYYILQHTGPLGYLIGLLPVTIYEIYIIRFEISLKANALQHEYLQDKETLHQERPKADTLKLCGGKTKRFWFRHVLSALVLSVITPALFAATAPIPYKGVFVALLSVSWLMVVIRMYDQVKGVHEKNIRVLGLSFQQKANSETSAATHKAE